MPDKIPLTEEQLEKIAEVVADKIMSRSYELVGKSVIKAFLWIVGVISVAVWAILTARGTVSMR